MLPATSAGPGSVRDPSVDPVAERALIVAAEARIASHKSQLEAVLVEATKIDSLEKGIVDLQRRKELEEQNYRYFSENLEKARIDEALDPTKVPNISKVQEPSTGRRASTDLARNVGIVAALGIALGIGLALLIDLVLDPSIKRPLEIESRLRIPLMLTIPLVAHNGTHRRLLGGTPHKRPRKRRRRLLADYRPAPPPPRPERAPWEISHFVRPFCDALRDRLLLLFQLKEMTHKPKLVALTSCSEGAGVTTLAAGLAAALSETGAGKVLLVDMNFNQPKARSFLRGAFAPSLSKVILPGGNIGEIRSDNLYLATGTEAGADAGALIPRQFYDLMPRLKASDFDYIIFDLPPMTQTSSTMALAPFMDEVILVIEAEQDSRDQVKRAHDVLSNSRANVVGVFNKNRTRTPGWLQQDL
jgi:Mrp family chromosome partitioning ATPase